MLYLPKLSSQTRLLNQIVYIYLKGHVQSFKNINIQNGVVYQNVFFSCGSVFILYFCFFFFSPSTQVLLMAVLLVFIFRIYPSQFLVAESQYLGSLIWDILLCA